MAETELFESIKAKLTSYDFTAIIINDSSLKKIHDLFIKDTMFEPINCNEYYYVAIYYQNVMGDYENTKKYYLMAIEEGHVTAMHYLACHYLDFEKDYLNAIKYFLMATENNYSDSMVKLADLFECINEDRINTEKYYLMAINHGNIIAMRKLGYYYQRIAIFKNAKKYYLMAIENGNVIAMNDLGKLFLNNGDHENAEKYFLMAIEHGNFCEKDKLIHCYDRICNDFGYLKIYRLNKDLIARNTILNKIKNIWASTDKCKPEQKKILMETLSVFKFEPTDKIPMSLELFIELLHNQVDAMKLHFTYTVNGEGFQEAHRDFIDNITNSQKN